MQEHEQIHIDKIDEIDEIQSQRVALWPCRLLVVAFFCSFLACLAALWFSGTLLSAPDHLLPASFLQFIASHRLAVLIVPALCLATCYGSLRFLTYDIMAVPERFLDERQKMLRDQAHRSAFKIIKLACLLIPCAFLLPHLPWFNSSSHTSAPVATAGHISSTFTPNSLYEQWMLAHQAALALQNAFPPLKASHVQYIVLGPPVHRVLTQPSSPAIPPVIAPVTTAEITLAGGLLLLCLLFVASALPMAVLAWKGKRA